MFKGIDTGIWYIYALYVVYRWVVKYFPADSTTTSRYGGFMKIKFYSCACCLIGITFWWSQLLYYTYTLAESHWKSFECTKYRDLQRYFIYTLILIIIIIISFTSISRKILNIIKYIMQNNSIINIVNLRRSSRNISTLRTWQISYKKY